MEAAVECTHCRVVMTSWSAPGSSIRYYQCPFCARTHSSLYGEVFRRRAGARLVDAPAPRAPSACGSIPVASPEDVRWAKVKQTAARWFARVEAEQRRCAPGTPLARVAPRAVIARAPLAPAAALLRRAAGAAGAPRLGAATELPEADPEDVVELAPARRLPAARSRR